MHSTVRKSLTGAAAVAALGLGGAALADAASSGTPSTATPPSSAAPPSSTTPPSGRPGPGFRHRDAPPALTGDAADKVQAAALAKVPGATLLRSFADPRGDGYVAFLRKSDGTFAVVRLDKDYKVTDVRADEGFRGGPGGPGPRGDHDGRRGDCPNMGGSGSGSSSGSSTAPSSVSVPGDYNQI